MPINRFEKQVFAPDAKLDHVLTYLKDQRRSQYLPDIYKWAAALTNIDRADMEQIIKKLVTDGYAIAELQPDQQYKYRISFEGLEFRGYAALQKLTSRQGLLQRLHRWGLTSGAVLTGGYGIVEVLN